MNSLRYLFQTLPWLGICAAILLAWYFYIKARNKERMALIEKGVDLSEIYSKQEVGFIFPWLKLGIVITGISLGVSLVVLLIIIFPEKEILVDAIGPLMLISGFMFGGIAMIISHFTHKSGKK